MSNLKINPNKNERPKKDERTADKYIDSLTIHRSNFEHIAKTGDINGSLRSDLKQLVNQIREDAMIDALHEIGMGANNIWAAQDAIKDLRAKKI